MISITVPLLKADLFCCRIVLLCFQPSKPSKFAGVVMSLIEDIAALPDTSSESPIDNLPVASGKKRRGRPRKHIEASAGVPAPPKSGMTGELRRTVAGIAKQVASSAVRKAVREAAPTDPGIRDEVQGIVGAAIKKDIVEHEGSLTRHPFWHIMRLR